MTEFEIRQTMEGAFGLMNEAAMMYFTLVSAYLAVGYLVAKRLSRTQLSIITTLYIVWVLGTINNVFAMLLVAQDNARKLAQVAETGNDPVVSTEAAVWSFMIVQIGGLVASLYFMWSSRQADSQTGED